MAVKQHEPQELGVLMIDFSPVIREGLQSILTKDEGIEVVGDAPNEYEALQHIKRAYAVGARALWPPSRRLPCSHLQPDLADRGRSC